MLLSKTSPSRPVTHACATARWLPHRVSSFQGHQAQALAHNHTFEKPIYPTPGSLSIPHRTQTRSVTAQAGKTEMSNQQEVAIVGGGCFWCIETCYNSLRGVYSAISGYAGGHVPNPTYEQVCGKQTGHAEVVKVTFDPSVIDYKTILEVLFSLHDPTTKDRQGNDVGPQYRSMIMYMNDEQKKIAEEVMKEVTDAKIWSGPLVTELVPFKNYYDAEKYHQRYYEQNPGQGYCSFVVGPKVSKFRQKWAKYLTTSTVA